MVYFFLLTNTATIVQSVKSYFSVVSGLFQIKLHDPPKYGPPPVPVELLILHEL